MWRLVTAKGKSIVVRRLPAQVGSDRGGDVVLPHASIAPRHARLTQDGPGSLMVEALDEAVVGVGGKRVRRGRLTDGTVLVLGTVRLTVQAPSAANAGGKAPLPDAAAAPTRRPARPPAQGRTTPRRTAQGTSAPRGRSRRSAAGPQRSRPAGVPLRSARHDEGAEGWTGTDLSQVSASMRLLIYAGLAVLGGSVIWGLMVLVGG